MGLQEILKKIAEAKPTQGGNFIVDGDYTYLIERIGLSDGHAGNCFIAELRVLESKKTEADVDPNPAGSSVSFVQNLTKYENAPGNVKAFMNALYGLEEGQVPAEQAQQILAHAIGEGNPCRGMKVRNSTYRKMNQGKANPANRGKMMTLNKFIHVPGQTVETIAQGKAQLDNTSAVSPTSPPAAVVPAPTAAPQTQVATPAILSGLPGFKP